MSAEARLRYYASFFDTVEVDSAYYAIPDARNARLWAERTPDGFVFNVKAYALMTAHHPRRPTLPAEIQALLPARPALTRRGEIDAAALPPEAVDIAFRLFRAALAPLEERGKLGYVLFQFAPWFRYGPRQIEFVSSLSGRLPGLRLAVEFRDRSWIPDHADETLDVLARARLAHVVVDAPRLASAVPRLAAVTAPTAVVRLHGRHAAGFLKQLRGEGPPVREKYDYLYREEELRELVPEVEALAREAEEVFIAFNNNNRNYPVVNALMMRRLLGQEVRQPPGQGTLDLG
jgi:uncharacterized protein YecE (DUF72 family)